MEQNTGSYFFCAKRDLPRLIERAQREAADVLKETLRAALSFILGTKCRE